VSSGPELASWEELDRAANVFTGLPLVDDDAVGRAFVRSVESMETGEVYEP
jgi:hypothetical protein